MVYPTATHTLTNSFSSMLIRATIFCGLYAAFVTANVYCDNSGTNPKGTKDWCHVACKVYVGKCCSVILHAGSRCYCGAIYDHGWNKHCAGDDCTANAHNFPDPAKKKAFSADTNNSLTTEFPGNLIVGQR